MLIKVRVRYHDVATSFVGPCNSIRVCRSLVEPTFLIEDATYGMMCSVYKDMYENVPIAIAATYKHNIKAYVCAEGSLAGPEYRIEGAWIVELGLIQADRIVRIYPNYNKRNNRAIA